MIWAGLSNAATQYPSFLMGGEDKNLKVREVTRDIAIVIISLVALYLAGGLVGQARMDDEPYHSAWYNLMEDLQQVRGKPPIQRKVEPSFWNTQGQDLRERKFTAL